MISFKWDSSSIESNMKQKNESHPTHMYHYTKCCFPYRLAWKDDIEQLSVEKHENGYWVGKVNSQPINGNGQKAFYCRSISGAIPC